MGFRNTVGALALVACSGLLLQADSTKSNNLPPGVMKAFAEIEKDYCDHSPDGSKKACHQTFRANLLWCELVITPSGQAAILVENKNIGWCGSGGCDLRIFVQQPDKKIVEVFEELGGFAEVKTRNHGKEHTLYRWDGEAV